MPFIASHHLLKKVIAADNLKSETNEIAVPIHLLAKSVSVVIDAAGDAEKCGHFTLTTEMLKHLKEAYFEADADAPSETDAVVDVKLYNETDGADVVALTFSGEGGHKTSSDISSDLSGLAGKVLSVRITVSTASATSGATQVFRSAVLRLVFGVS